MSDRQRRSSLFTLVTATALAGAIASPAAFAQRDYSKVEIKTEQVSGNVYALFGAGGNIGVLAGSDGVMMVDDQFAPLSDKILAAVRAINEGPVRFLLNTHWHFDHTGGNENIAGETGANIIAHHNVRVLMSSPQEIGAFGAKIPAAPEIARPVLTYGAEGATVHLNGETVRIVHVPEAHTDGDSVAFFEEANVIHTGDTFFNGFYPFIDVEHGGTVMGMIEAADVTLALGNEQTKIIPGHGPMGSKDDLRAFQSMLKDLLVLMAESKHRGDSVKDVLDSDEFKAIDAVWGKGFMKGARFLQLVYPSI